MKDGELSETGRPDVGRTTTYDKTFGVRLTDRRWVPAPRYLLRRHRILRLVQVVPKGCLLEIGSGAGALLVDLARQGFRVEALESSAEARALSREMLWDLPEVTVYGEPQAGWACRFDVLVSLEVLEHIENDSEALSAWVQWLKPGGRVLLAVPCGMRKWGPLDDWAGHVRRYERDELVRLVESAGLQVDRFECYGFPIANVTSSVRNRLLRRRRRRSRPAIAAHKDERDARTGRSGVDRTLEARFFPMQDTWLGRWAVRAGCRIQDYFLETDLGDGYIVLATKR